jgi:hypothetical protein
MAGADLLNRGTGTAVSQLSEVEQGIMCVKEGIDKYYMWYGVVCKAVMFCTSAVFSLAGGRDTVPCLAITAIFKPEPQGVHIRVYYETIKPGFSR